MKGLFLALFVFLSLPTFANSPVVATPFTEFFDNIVGTWKSAEGSFMIYTKEGDKLLLQGELVSVYEGETYIGFIEGGYEIKNRNELWSVPLSGTETASEKLSVAEVAPRLLKFKVDYEGGYYYQTTKISDDGKKMDWIYENWALGTDGTFVLKETTVTEWAWAE